jgi:hypothetical protein
MTSSLNKSFIYRLRTAVVTGFADCAITKECTPFKRLVSVNKMVNPLLAMAAGTAQVGIATRLRAARPRSWGSIIGRGNTFFSSP